MTTLTGPQAEALADQICARPESKHFETKRVSGKMVGKALEAVCAFANTEGGILALGVEDSDKAKGRARLYGLIENPEAVDELSRKLNTQFNPPMTGLEWYRLQVRLRDGEAGEIALIRVPQSAKVHSIIDNGTWTRLDRSNRVLSAEEIIELSYRRGTRSAETQGISVPLDFLETEAWRSYCKARGYPLANGIAERLSGLGLAEKNSGGRLLPSVAAVLLFADEPGTLLSQHTDGRATLRIFHYKGRNVMYTADTNLKKPPKTISGPLIRQITQAHEYVMNELADGVRMVSGLQAQYSFPSRTVREAITNAVLHRDYRLNRDILIRIFDDRLEVESPGLFAGNISPANIFKAGSFARNKLITQHIREFPDAPNFELGEGVKLMLHEMRENQFYPPIYEERSDEAVQTVRLTLLNESLPPAWEQVSRWIDDHGQIANRDVTHIAEVDRLDASRMLKRWVENGLLVKDESRGRALTVYRKPQRSVGQDLLISGEPK